MGGRLLAQHLSTDGDRRSGIDHGRLRSARLARRLLYDSPQLLRAAARLGFYPGYRSNKIGFRVARTL
jgi:formylglycine-generating enzyme required for sulfatase activity